MIEFTIFINQFLVIYMLGLQSLMVRDGNIVGAMAGSLAIGIGSFYLYGAIGQLGPEAIGTSMFYAFIVAGPLAIATAMKTHPLLQKHLFRR